MEGEEKLCVVCVYRYRQEIFCEFISRTLINFRELSPLVSVQPLAQLEVRDWDPFDLTLRNFYEENIFQQKFHGKN